MMLQRLESIERLMQRLLNQRALEAVEEISLTKTSKLLHRSTDTIKQMVDDGTLRGSKEIINGTVEYRFKISDIQKYQKDKVL